MLLFKCLLFQKWFHIKSDPELGSQINDRISFKSFLSLPMDYSSPDHSTFSRFRKRLSKETMIKANSELLHQFHGTGLASPHSPPLERRFLFRSKYFSKSKHFAFYLLTSNLAVGNSSHHYILRINRLVSLLKRELL